MDIKIRLIIMLMVVAFLLYVFRLVAKKEVEMRNILVWLILSGAIFILVLFPGIAELISSLVGVVLPINFIFFAGFCLLLMISFSLTKLTSTQAVQIRQLVQKIALLEKALEDEK